MARQLFLLVATSHFDDFTVVTTADAADCVTHVVNTGFRLLRWTLNKPFNETFETPGARVGAASGSGTLRRLLAARRP